MLYVLLDGVGVLCMLVVPVGVVVVGKVVGEAVV